MRRAVELSRSHWGLTHPNPSVGCVLARGGRVLAEAVTAVGGRPHAEALCLAGRRGLADATLYVTLEPCTHHGRTPPCADLIIRSGVRRVLVGVLDPNPLVNGKGFRRLRRAGVTVLRDVLAKECAEPNEWFFKRFKSPWPYVTIKTAVSLDGKIATAAGESRWISSPASRAYGHLLRLRHDAVMVGTETLRRDNPELTVRHGRTAKQPHKVVLDRKGTLPASLAVFRSVQGEQVFYFTASRSRRFENHPFIRPFRVPARKGRLDLDGILRILKDHEVFSILVEGGGSLNAELIEQGMVDRVCAVVAPRLVGGAEAPTLFDGRGFPSLAEAPTLQDVRWTPSGADMIVEGFLRRWY